MAATSGLAITSNKATAPSTKMAFESTINGINAPWITELALTRIASMVTLLLRPTRVAHGACSAVAKIQILRSVPTGYPNLTDTLVTNKHTRLDNSAAATTRKVSSNTSRSGERACNTCSNGRRVSFAKRDAGKISATKNGKITPMLTHSATEPQAMNSGMSASWRFRCELKRLRSSTISSASDSSPCRAFAIAIAIAGRIDTFKAIRFLALSGKHLTATWTCHLAMPSFQTIQSARNLRFKSLYLLPQCFMLRRKAR